MGKPPTDNQLVKKARQGCSESVSELISRHTPLVAQILRRYESILIEMGMAPQDLYDEIPNIVYEAARQYKPKTKFSTWLCNCSRWHCLKLISKLKRNLGKEDDHALIQVSQELSEREESWKEDQENIGRLKEIIKEIGDHRIKTVLRMKYFGKNKKSFQLIAKGLKMSTQGVIDLNNRGLRFIKEKVLENS